MRQLETSFPVDAGVYRIELRLANLTQFFNTFDPSPFHDKDIDDEAERYIVDSVRAFPLKTPLKLVFYLPQEYHLEAVAVLPAAIENYFDFRVAMASREIQSLLRDGRVALLFGLCFLGICVSVSTGIGLVLQGTAGAMVREGLTIIGWVAMWRPVQIFLYDWWGALSRRRLYAKIRDMAIEICLD